MTRTLLLGGTGTIGKRLVRLLAKEPGNLDLVALNFFHGLGWFIEQLGGRVEAVGDSLQVSGADSVTLTIVAAFAFALASVALAQEPPRAIPLDAPPAATIVMDDVEPLEDVADRAEDGAVRLRRSP